MTEAMPRITSMFCKGGNGMMASLFPLVMLAFSTNRKITDAAKQRLQMKTILEKKRKEL